MPIWNTTPLINTPLTGSSYDYNITSLSASTIYEIRSYVIVNGNPYYGNTIIGTTTSESFTVPTVSTGSIGHPPTTSGFIIANNLISSKGGSLPILEYGMLYTQESAYGSDSTLIYNASPLFVHSKRTSTYGDTPAIPPTYHYSGVTTGLSENTLTYYRAFARNSVGVGYGAIQTQTTSQNIGYTVDVVFANIAGNYTRSPDQYLYYPGDVVLLTAFDNPNPPIIHGHQPVPRYFQYWTYDGNNYYDYELPITVTNYDVLVSAYFTDNAELKIK